MLRALAANLVLHERIETTDAKAKELRRVAERLITRAVRLGPVAFTPHDKLNPAERARRLAAQKQVGRFLRRFGVKQSEGESETVDLVEKVFADLAKRYQGRPGGYTRIIKLGRRRGDAAHMSLIELVESGTGAAAAAKPEQSEEAPKAETPPAAEETPAAPQEGAPAEGG